MAEPISIQLTPESVHQIIQANVQAAVIDAMRKDGDRFITELVRGVLLAKTQRNYRETTVLNSAIQDFMEVEIKTAMKAYLAEHSNAVQSEISKMLKVQTRDLATKMFTAFLGMVENNYRFNVSLDRNG